MHLSYVVFSAHPNCLTQRRNAPRGMDVCIITIPARCLQAPGKPQPRAPGTQSLKLKYHNVLMSSFLSHGVGRFSIHLQSAHASPGLFAKGVYSNGCDIRIALHFLDTHLIILTESVCLLFGNVHAVKAIIAYI